jgi:copper homeostasis protein (lipoprotein)
MRAFIIRLLASLLLAPLAGACGSSEAPSGSPTLQPAAQPGAAPGPTVLRYSGTLPCADCAGIRTDLTLTRDAAGQPQTYELAETYLGSTSPDGEKTMTSSGRWTIDRGAAGQAEMTVYRLDGGGDEQRARSFERLSDQEIRQLDRQGNRIESQLNYSLTAVPLLAFPANPAGGGVATPAPSMPVPAAMVTDMASGWPLTLQVGQDLSARLAVDRANGARWTMRPGSDGGILAQQGPPTFESAEGRDVEVFQFKATKPGKAELTFELRPGGSGSPTRTVSYQVTVP